MATTMMPKLAGSITALAGAKVVVKDLTDHAEQLPGEAGPFRSYQVRYGNVTRPIPQSLSGTRGAIPKTEVHKQLIEGGKRLFVVGSLTRAGDTVQVGDPQEGRLMIVAKDEKAFVRELRSSAGWMVPFGGVVLGLGGLLLLLGLFKSLTKGSD